MHLHRSISEIITAADNWRNDALSSVSGTSSSWQCLRSQTSTSLAFIFTNALSYLSNMLQYLAFSRSYVSAQASNRSLSLSMSISASMICSLLWQRMSPKVEMSKKSSCSFFWIEKCLVSASSLNSQNKVKQFVQQCLSGTYCHLLWIYCPMLKLHQHYQQHSLTGHLIICNCNNTNFQLYILTEGAHEMCEGVWRERE